MKRLGWLVLLVVSLTILAVSSTVWAEPLSPKEQREAYLQEQVARINNYLNEGVQDQQLTAEEMHRLVTLVNKFSREWKEAKDIYGDLSMCGLNSKISEAVSLYTRPFFWHGLRDRFTIMAYFSEASGKDILYLDIDCQWVVFWTLILFLGLGSGIFAVGHYGDNANTKVLGIGVIALVGLFFLLALVGG